MSHALSAPFALATVRLGEARLAAALLIDDHLVDATSAADALGSELAAELDRHGRELGAQALLRDWDRCFELARELAEAVRARGADDATWSLGAFEPGDARIGSPLPAPPKILCAASNYAAHVRDFDHDERQPDIRTVTSIDRTTTLPYLFPKLASSVAGPYDAIVRPQPTENLDFEIELAAVLGRPGKRIPADRAGAHIAGFLIANDLTSRDLQVREDWTFFRSDWFAGKCFDGAVPLGPFLVPAAFVPDYRQLRLQLSVNGEMRQDGLADDMVFSIEEQIAFASSVTGLVPGDVFATGTPAGVGAGTGRFLELGDVVEGTIEGLGVQRAIVVAEPLAPDDRFELVPPDAHLARQEGPRV